MHPSNRAGRWQGDAALPLMLAVRHVENGKTPWVMPLYPYPTRTGWNAATSSFQPVDGPRRGVDRIAERFRPPAAE